MTRTSPSWQQANIGDLADVLDSQRVPVNAEERARRIAGLGSTELVPYYGANGQAGWIDSALFNEDLVLLGEDGVPFLDRYKQKAYRVSGPSWVNNHAHVLRVRKEVCDSRHLERYLNQANYEGLVSGTTRLKLTKAAMLSMRIPLPPLEEQQRIADKLDTVLARVDGCRDRLSRVAPLLKRFRQSVLDAAVFGVITEEWRRQNGAESAAQLGRRLQLDHEDAGGHQKGNAADATAEAHDLSQADLPATWTIVTLKDLCVPGRPITYGILKPGPELGVGVPYIRVADFPGNRLNLQGIKKTSAAIDEQYKRARLKAGDLLMSIRGSVGRLVQIPEVLEGANITQDTARLSISSRVEVRYIYWTLLAQATQRRMQRAVRGVAVRGINIGDVRALQIPLPPLKEQQEIVSRVETLFGFADRLEARLASAQASADRLTPALLAKAFRGELVPQDPNDEPATELLARLQSQRAAAPAKRSGRKAPVKEATA